MFDFIKRLLGFNSCNHDLKLIGYLHGDEIIYHDYKRFKYECIHCKEIFYFEHAIDCIGCKYLWLNCSGQAECTKSGHEASACLTSHHRVHWELDSESEQHDFKVPYKGKF